VRPQITVLWRIPGTTIYRNMKQESKGCFIPNVFLCRIGSSLYFANAAYVKEMLLSYVADLDEVNPTQYIVIEMTGVTSVDSSACHVIHDIVSDFRQRGIQVAFANLDPKVGLVMRKAGLKKEIQKQWFFANVDDAVRFCMRHQHTKKTKQEFDGVTGHVSAVNIGVSNEIGFSNDLTSGHTMMFLTLDREAPSVVGEISEVFAKHQCVVARTLIEPLQSGGAKHTYFLQSGKTQAKLSERELERVREDLEHVTRKVAQQPKDLEEGGNELCEEGVSSTKTSKSVKSARPHVETEEEKQRIAALEEQVRTLTLKQRPSNACTPSTACTAGVMSCMSGEKDKDTE